jgi:hypothetical protein
MREALRLGPDDGLIQRHEDYRASRRIAQQRVDGSQAL